MNILNGHGESKRYTLTLIGFVGIIVCAVLKHWIKGIDVTLVITAAGLITGYNASESYRPSGTQGVPNRGCAPGKVKVEIKGPKP